MLDRFFKIISLGGTFLVFNGVVYLSIYYKSFNINILSYIEFTEVLTSFIDSIDTIITFFGIYMAHFILTFLIYYRSAGPRKITGDVVGEHKGSTPVPNSRKRRKNVDVGKQFGYVIQFGFTLILMILVISGKLALSKWILYVFCFTGLNVIQSLLASTEKFFSKHYAEKYFCIFLGTSLFILPFLTYTIVFAVFNASEIKKNPPSATVIEKDGSVIQVNYIGKTHKYFFLYDTYEKRSASFSLENVKTIYFN
jgi:hypothetical protein